MRKEWQPPPHEVLNPQGRVSLLRMNHEARLAAMTAAAEERRTADLAAKQAELDVVMAQLQQERSQQRTTQAALDR